MPTLRRIFSPAKLRALALAVLTAGAALWPTDSQAAFRISAGINYGSHGLGGHHYGHSYHGYRHAYGAGFYGFPYYYGARPGYSISAGSYCPPVYSSGVAYTVPYTTRSYAAPAVTVVQTTPAYTVRRSVVQQNVPVTQAVYGVRTATAAQPQPNPAPPTQSAWTLLGAGQYQAAAEKFAAEMAAHPEKGNPKVGYSLATALNNDYDSAIASMRRAFLYDPEGASYAPGDSELAKKIHELAMHYHKMAEKYPRDVDAMFMLAATCLLIHDQNAASPAIQNVITAGDSTTAALNLKKQIDDRSPSATASEP